MDQPKVLAIVTCYSRPHNMNQIIQAVKEQTVQCELAIVDNRDADDRGVGYDWGHADQMWNVWGVNLRNTCRFLPVYSPKKYDYLWFLDDDLLPGRQAVEHCLHTALLVDDKFATIGSHGRRFNLEGTGDKYSGRSCPMTTPYPIPVDLTCRTHFVRHDLLELYLRAFQDGLYLSVSVDHHDYQYINDDFVMCGAIQKAMRFPSYIPPTPPTIEHRMVKVELDETGAVWKKPGHFKMRNQMVNYLQSMGWERCW